MEIGNRRKKRSSKLSVRCRDLGVAVLDWIAFWIRLPICLLPLTFYTNLNKGAHELITHFCSLSQQLLRKFNLVMRRVFLQNFQVCIIFHLHVVRKWIEAGLKLSALEDRNQGVVLLFFGGERREKKWEACSCRITKPFQILCKLPSRDFSLFTKVTSKTFIT